MLELYMPVQIDLYYQKVVVLPLFVTIPFSRSQKMTQKLALFLNVFSEGVTICITYIEIA